MTCDCTSVCRCEIDWGTSSTDFTPRFGRKDTDLDTLTFVICSFDKSASDHRKIWLAGLWPLLVVYSLLRPAERTTGSEDGRAMNLVTRWYADGNYRNS